MSKYRHNLPHVDGALCLTDGGLETTLIYDMGVELPHFAAFDLLRSDEGRHILRALFRPLRAPRSPAPRRRRAGIGDLARQPRLGRRLGYDAAMLDRANRAAIDLLCDVRATFETAASPIVISGNLGPRGDGYKPAARMSVHDARDYHAAQIETFRDTDADLVSAFTMNYVEEAIGIALAARTRAMPVVISFTLETDGRLPSGRRALRCNRPDR